jgi:hypothetical protein
MSERIFRLIQGIYLLTALYFDLDILIYIFMGVFLFEAITNWRVPTVVSRLRYGSSAVASASEDMSTERIKGHYSFEAERMLRITVAFLLVLTFILYPEPMWFFPWFIAAMLLSAGITNICPMVMFYRFLGFR